MQICFQTKLASFPIKLEQSKSGKVFKITYGLQINTTWSYSEAAALLGQAIMHAAACEGLLDNEAPND
jgi:hypothetical protein